MTTIEELRARRLAAYQAANELYAKADEESRRLDDDEANRYAELMTEFKTLTDEISRRQQLEDAKGLMDGTSGRSVPSDPDWISRTDGSRQERRPQRFRYSRLRAFKGARADEDAYRAGQWFRAAILGNQQARDWCRENNIELRVMTTGKNAAGGYVVPVELESAIIDLREEYGLARQECRIRPMGSDNLLVPRRAGGITMYAIGENTEITASDKSWSNVELVARKWGALTRMSTDLADDAIINMADDLADEMAWAAVKKEDECLIDGDGTSTYHGIVGFRAKMVDGNHAASYADATAGDDQFTELLLPDIISLVGKLPGYAHFNAKWYMSYYAYGSCVLRLLSALSGNAMQNIADGMTPQLLGYPIKLSAAMPSATSAYNELVMIAFGNMRQAADLGDRRGITLRTSTDRYLEYDQIGVQMTERMDINVHDLGDASTAGPLVGLRGNTS